MVSSRWSRTLGAAGGHFWQRQSRGCLLLSLLPAPVLCFLCPFCKRQNGILDPRTRPGHCSRCGQCLAPTTADALSDNQALTNDELQWKNWTTTVLGEVLASAPRLQSPPERDGIAKIIDLCVERITDGNASAFARAMEAGRGDVRRWQTSKALPKFPSLLSLSYRIGMPLLDLLRGAPTPLPQKFVRSFPAAVQQGAAHVEEGAPTVMSNKTCRRAGDTPGSTK